MIDKVDVFMDFSELKKWVGLPSVDEYQGLNLKNLSLNSAYVLANTSFEKVFVYVRNDNCYECPSHLMKKLERGVETSWVVNTSESNTWKFVNKGDMEVLPRTRYDWGLICDMRPTFNEFGVYRLDIGRCEAKSLIPTQNTYLPLLLFVSLLLSCASIYTLIKLILRCKSRSNKEYDLEINRNTNEGSTVYFYRGLVLLLLIFVTSGGGGYPIFTRKYGGLSVADYLFLVYTWTVGIKIPKYIDKAGGSGKKNCAIFGDIFTRAFILVFVGITVDSTISQFPNKVFWLWRPLETVGVSYLIASSAYLLSLQKLETKSERLTFKMLSNLMSLMWCWIVSGFILALMIVLISILISYNCVIKTPINNEDYIYNIADETVYCNNDLTKFINIIMTSEAKKTIFVHGYFGFTGGLLGILTTVMTTMIGLKCGVVYLHQENHSDRLKLWALWGAVFAVGGVLFAGVSLPVKLNLWPISTFLLVTSFCHFLFIAAYTSTEVLNFSNSIIKNFGLMSLPILCGHLLLSDSLNFILPCKLNNHFLYLLQNSWVIFIWVIVSIFLKRNNIFVSI